MSLNTVLGLAPLIFFGTMAHSSVSPAKVTEFKLIPHVNEDSKTVNGRMFVFKMSGGREIRYVFGNRPDLAGGAAPDRIETVINGHIHSVSGQMRILGVFIPPYATADDIAKIGLPKGVITIKADPDTKMVLRIGGEHDRRDLRRFIDMNWLDLFVEHSEQKAYESAHGHFAHSENLAFHFPDLKIPADFVWNYRDFPSARTAIERLKAGLEPKISLPAVTEASRPLEWATPPEPGSKPPSTEPSSSERRAQASLQLEKLARNLRPGLVTELVDRASRHVIREANSLSLRTESGSKVDLPNHQPFLEHQDTRIHEFVFQYKEESFAIVSVELGELLGETFVVRLRDGEFTRWGNSSVIRDDLSISEDGILSAQPGIPRRIDLDRFDMETRFNAAYRKTSRELVWAKTKNDKVPVQGLPKGFVDSAVEGSDDEVIFQDIGEAVLLNPKITPDVDPRLERAVLRGMVADDLGSSVILGPGGTGKSHDVDSLIKKIKLGRTLIPRTWNFIEVDAAALEAGGGKVGVIQKRLQMLKQMSGDSPTVFKMDEIHAMRGAGTHSGNTNDAFQALKARLADGSMRIIGMSTVEEFYPAFQGDSALISRFSIFHKEEPTELANLRAILENWLKARKKIAASMEVLEEVVSLSNEFNAAGAQPRKALELLDRVYADLLLDGKGTRPPTGEEVRQVAYELYHVDPRLLDFDYVRALLSNFPAAVDGEIAGFADAKAAVAGILEQNFTGVADRSRPRLRILIMGPKGSGKSGFGEALAKALHVEAHTIDMSLYGPQGQGPVDLQNKIGQQLNKNSFTVFMIEEIEKATLTNQNALLEIFNKGIFTVKSRVGSGYDSNQRSVRMSARNASFVLTSNAHAPNDNSGEVLGFRGAADAREMRASGAGRGAEDLSTGAFGRAAVKGGISEALVDRLQAIFASDNPSRSQFVDILRIQIRKAQSEIQRERHLEFRNFEVDRIAEALAAKYFRPGITGRASLNIIMTEIRGRAANMVLTTGPQSRVLDFGGIFDSATAKCRELLSTGGGTASK